MSKIRTLSFDFKAVFVWEGSMRKNIAIFIGLGVLLFGCVGPDQDSESVHLIRVAQKARNSSNPEAALSFYKKAKELDPDNAQIYLGLGEVYVDMNLLDAAVEYLKMAEDRGASPSKISYLRGKIHLLSGKPGLAEKEFSKFENEDSLNALGAIYDKRNEREKAQRFYKRVIAKDPNYIDAYNNLGLSLLLERKYRDAIFYLESACTFPGANVNYRSNLALAYGLSGNMKKSREVYAKDFEDEALEERIANLEDIIAERQRQ